MRMTRPVGTLQSFETLQLCTPTGDTDRCMEGQEEFTNETDRGRGDP